MIFVDRKRFFRTTASGGCRYICNFTESLEGLSNGDVAVFSVGFNVSLVKELRRKGVLIAFVSGESPVHMPSLSRDQLEQVCGIISSFFSCIKCGVLYCENMVFCLCSLRLTFRFLSSSPSNQIPTFHFYTLCSFSMEVEAVQLPKKSMMP